MKKFLKTSLAVGIALMISHANADVSTAASASGSESNSSSSASNSTAAVNSSNSAFANDNDKVSYAIGINLGDNFKRQGVTINPDMIAKGLEDATTTGAKPLMNADEINSTMTQFQKDFIAKREALMKTAADKNQKEGDDYLAKNKSLPGVVALPSGVQYKIIEEGKGTSPVDTDTVTVNYEGKLINGTVFDSSYTRGKSVSFPVNQVIPGWTEVLKLMKPGATWEVAIPAKAAYGSSGAGGMIGPNQTLLFKINLVEVKKPNADKNGKKDT